MQSLPSSRSAFAVATVITAVAQVITLLGAAILGVLVGNAFGAGVATDGFFTANAIYAISLLVAQSFRTTTVAKLVDADGQSQDRLNQYMAGTALLAGGAAASHVVVGLFAGPLFVADGAQESFRTAMLLLAPASALQLFAGIGAAMLAVHGAYGRAAAAFAAAGVANIAAFVLLKDRLGIDGIATALIAGAATAALVVGHGLWRRGWRPATAPLQAARGAARLMLLGGAALIATQLLITASVTLAGGARTGGATIYTYAAMLIVALNAGLSSPISIVFAPVVARGWDRKPESLRALTLRSYRVGALVLAPAVASIYLLGWAPAGEVLTKISDDDIGAIFQLVPLMAIGLLPTMLMMIPLVAIFTVGRTVQLARGFALLSTIHIALSVAVAALGGGLTALAVVGLWSTFALAAFAIALVNRVATAQLIRAAVGWTIRLPLVGALCFGLPPSRWDTTAASRSGSSPGPSEPSVSPRISSASSAMSSTSSGVCSGVSFAAASCVLAVPARRLQARCATTSSTSRARGHGR